MGSRTSVVRVYFARLPGAVLINDMAVSPSLGGAASSWAAIPVVAPRLQAPRNASTWRAGNAGLAASPLLRVTTKTPAPTATTTPSARRVRSRQKRRRGLTVKVSPTGPYCARAGQPRRVTLQLQWGRWSRQHGTRSTSRGGPMYVGMSKEQEALRDELRAYYDELLTPEVVADIQKGEGVGQKSKDVWKQMAADGYAGVGWPKEWGGRGLTPIEQFVFFDESMRAGAPVPMLTINSVAPTIMRFGSEEQKQFYVPKILKGEIHFAIGYTEPDAGTDLASLKTKAVRDGDEYVINGQKVFTSLASGSDYIWLAVRTSQEAKKHKGISIIIVPTDTPGFRYVPIDNFGATNTNITYYEDVRVPVGNLVGEENGGWGLITNQLNHERVMLCFF